MKVKLMDTAPTGRAPSHTRSATRPAPASASGSRRRARTFTFAYRARGSGKTVRLTLGRYPDVGLAQARELANDARKAIAAGGVPATAARRGEGAFRNFETAPLPADSIADALKSASQPNAHQPAS
jgi:hypothetical protein